MISFHDTLLQRLSVHHVGNKTNQGDLFLSQKEVEYDEELFDIFQSYFLKNFKTNVYFNFYHESDIKLNEMYVYVDEIFQ